MALDNNTVLNYTDKTTIRNWFKTGLKPTQTQFWSTWDSFWHKSETLPISSISGLGNLLDGKAEENHTHSEYATNDATSLTPANVISWQQALGVDDLDYVEIPTENAAENSHPYVVVIDDAGKSAKRNATEFGKVDTIDGIEANENKDVKLGAVRKSESNTVTDDFSMQQENGAYVSIASNGLKVGFGGITATYGTSSISVDNLVPDSAYKFQELLFPKRAVKNTEEKVYPVTYVQGVKADETGRVDISGVAWNYTNPSIRYSGIVDKSADATFNRMSAFDANGNLNYVTNPYQLLKSGLTLMTPAQALELGHLLGGGSGSEGAMSVNMISPPIVQNRFDSVEYVYLRGANLKLNATQRKIELINVNNNISVLTIPDNQIISENSTELVFYYNFKDFLVGEYKIRITSGAKIYTTDWTLKIVQEVQNIDFNSIVWDLKYNTEVVANPNDYANGSVISLTTPKDTQNRIVNSSKTSELFAEGENFYVELKIDLDSSMVQSINLVFSRVGLCYSNSQNSFVNLLLCSLGWNKEWGKSLSFYNNDSRIYFQRNTPTTFTVVFIKTGNLFRTIIDGYSSMITLSNNSGYSLILQNSSADSEIKVVSQITKAFKFN